MSRKKEVAGGPTSHPDQSSICKKIEPQKVISEAMVIARANLSSPFGVLRWASHVG